VVGADVSTRPRSATHATGGSHAAASMRLLAPGRDAVERTDRIDTIIDFAAAAQYGVKTEGNAAAASADVLAELAGLIDTGELELLVAKVYPLEQVRDAYRELEQRHTRGKIVLRP
jgi:NADPH:quinone reductase-like Zn-dependent oxidoreductase